MSFTSFRATSGTNMMMLTLIETRPPDRSRSRWGLIRALRRDPDPVTEEDMCRRCRAVVTQRLSSPLQASRASGLTVSS